MQEPECTCRCRCHFAVCVTQLQLPVPYNYSSACYTGFSHWSCTSLVADDRFLLKLLLCKGFKPLAYCLLVLFLLFLQGLSDSRLEKSQSLLHCFKSTKGKECVPLMSHCGAASDHKIQSSACPVSSIIIKISISSIGIGLKSPILH